MATNRLTSLLPPNVVLPTSALSLVGIYRTTLAQSFATIQKNNDERALPQTGSNHVHPLRFYPLKHPADTPYHPTYQTTLSTILSTHPLNPPLNPSYQPTLSTHTLNPPSQPSQPTLSTHTLNPPSQPTLSTLSTHPLNPLHPGSGLPMASAVLSGFPRLLSDSASKMVLLWMWGSEIKRLLGMTFSPLHTLAQDNRTTHTLSQYILQHTLSTYSQRTYQIMIHIQDRRLVPPPF